MVCNTQKVGNVGGSQGLATGPKKLVEEGQGIAQASFCGPGHHPGDGWVEGDILTFTDMLDSIGNL
jgi:hypothetical protein